MNRDLHKFHYQPADKLGKLLRGEKILSPPRFQHCGGERPRCPRCSDAFGRMDVRAGEHKTAPARNLQRKSHLYAKPNNNAVNREIMGAIKSHHEHLHLRRQIKVMHCILLLNSMHCSLLIIFWRLVAKRHIYKQESLANANVKRATAVHVWRRTWRRLAQRLRSFFPFLYVQDGRQPPSWILSNRK